MIILDIVLRDFALVGLFLLGQEVNREGLLQQRIALLSFLDFALGRNPKFIFIS